ncbi:hypothetical protein COC42_11975 [Sphingomonas spermidinifaciens]|uniref:Uncharacterized protein n=1 Tax=Sphingomonas spermidinifaciens TaxID=1141889 RepID=A0A2A4B365_9SPHN|nr:hypothetical protein [Sphingomonas spermidinifaciens]PCD02178.1 hypothetical protein COC42_11975 [Sphingomonas spermidinifaciens]
MPHDIAALAPLVTANFSIACAPVSIAIIRRMTQTESRRNQIARAILWICEQNRETYRIEEAAAVT